jgi:ferredoxin--NADP+ reductase
LSQERVAVIGIGNVAVDVARILCRTPDELASTDIADYALDALRESKVREVHMLGRRGPAQGAFTTPELKELGEMEDADTIVFPDEAELDDLSIKSMADADRGTTRKVQIIQDFAKRQRSGKSRQLYLRFLVSPVELFGDEHGRVSSMKLVHNELYATEAGTLRPQATDKFEDLPVGLVFRSIGYRGVPLPGVPFNDSWGVILNKEGRVLDPNTQLALPGEYTAGWIKRGPTGVIGTNKPDAAETADRMIEDLAEGAILDPDEPDSDAIERFIHERQPDYFSYQDWLRVNELEVERGEAEGRPRVKFTLVDKMIEAKYS